MTESFVTVARMERSENRDFAALNAGYRPFLPQLCGALEAGDHGDALEIVAGAPGVGRDPAQLVAEARLLGRVGRLEIALVLDRVLLHVFERHQPALPVVAVELGLVRLAADRKS